MTDNDEERKLAGEKDLIEPSPLSAIAEPLMMSPPCPIHYLD